MKCIVVAVARENDKTALKKGLTDYFGRERPVIGFSTLSGRRDLFAPAKELKDAGVFTILAGPQADVDYIGERGWEDHDHRFKGVSDRFSIALHGPAEQAVELLQNLDARRGGEIPGLLCRRADGEMIQLPDNLFSLFNVNDRPDLNPCKTAQIGTCRFAPMHCQDDVDPLVFGRDKTNFPL